MDSKRVSHFDIGGRFGRFLRRRVYSQSMESRTPSPFKADTGKTRLSRAPNFNAI